MNIWIKRILGVLPILGCGAGITVMAVGLPDAPMSPSTVVMLCMFTVAYVAGAVAGLMLLEGHRYAITANFFYWLAQTVHVMSFPLTFVFWAPFNLGGWWNITTSEAGLTAQIGSTFQFGLFSSDPGFAIEIDLFAIACCLCLYAYYRRERRQAPALIPAVQAQAT